MNYIQRIVQNTSFLLIGNIFSYIIAFLTIMYTARYLGAENFGIISLAFAFTGLFGVFMDLGLSSWMVREISKNKSLTNKYYSNIAVLKIIFSVMTFFNIISSKYNWISSNSHVCYLSNNIIIDN